MQFVFIPTSLLLLVIYISWVWKKCNKAFPFTLLFIIEISWQFISIVWIDSGAYISEQLRTSFFTGASIRYLILTIPFEISFPYFTEKNIDKYQKNNKMSIVNIKKYQVSSINSVLLVLSVLVVIYEYVNLLISGVPVLNSNMTTASFWRIYSKLPLAGTINVYVLPFVMLCSGIRLGKLLKNNNSITLKLLLELIIPIMIFVYQIILKNKFFGIYNYIIYALIPVFVMLYSDSNKKKKIPFKWIFVFLCGIGLIIYISYNHYAGIGKNPVQLLMDRVFALQSHTFWGVDLLLQNGTIQYDPERLFSEVLNGFLGVSNYDPGFGIARIMYLVSPSTYADDMLKSGYLFAGSFQTVSISYCGYYLTFAASFLLGIVLAKLTAFFYRCIHGNNYLLIYLVFYIYDRFLSFYRVGNLSLILSWKMCFVYLIIILCIVFEENTYKKMVSIYGK